MLSGTGTFSTDTILLWAGSHSSKKEGVGIAMPALIPPICSVILAWILYHQNPAPVAYVSGVLGTLIGADVLNLKRIKHMSCGVMSIGGAGVFDGIYLVGIIAVLLA